MLARVGPGNQVLTTILDITKWALVGFGEPGDTDFLLLEDTLVAKRTTDIGRDDTHLTLFHVQKHGHSGADHVRYLGRSHHHELIRLVVPVGQHGFALHGNHALSREADLAVHDDLSLGGIDVKVAVGGERQKVVVGPVLMDQVLLRLPGCIDIGIHRQRIEIHLNLLEHVLGLGTGGGKGHDHGFAHKSDLVVCEQGLRGGLIGWKGRVCDDVARVHHAPGIDPTGQRGRNVDVGELGVGNGAAQKGDFRQPRHGHVGNKVAFAMQMPEIFFARDSRTDALVVDLRSCSAVTHACSPVCHHQRRNTAALV